MTVRLRLPGGTLKIKRYPELRSSERRKEVPVIAIGGVYFVWWSRSAVRRKRLSMEQAASTAGVSANDD